MFIFVKKDGKNVGAFDRKEIKNIHFNGKTLAIGLKDDKVSCFTLSQTDVDAVMDQMGNEQECPKVAKEELKVGFYFPKDSYDFHVCLIKSTADNYVFLSYVGRDENDTHAKMDCLHFTVGVLGTDVFLTREEAEFHKLQLQNDALTKQISELKTDIAIHNSRIQMIANIMTSENPKRKFWD